MDWFVKSIRVSRLENRTRRARTRVRRCRPSDPLGHRHCRLHFPSSVRPAANPPRPLCKLRTVQAAPVSTQGKRLIHNKSVVQYIRINLSTEPEANPGAPPTGTAPVRLCSAVGRS